MISKAWKKPLSAFSIAVLLINQLLFAPLVFAQEATPSAGAAITAPAQSPAATPAPTVVPEATSSSQPSASVTPSPAATATPTPQSVWRSVDGGWETAETVKTDQTYTTPQSDKVTVKFNKLPDPAGKITVKEVKLTADQVKQTGALSDTAYDISSTMVNGTFEYALTLPTPKTDNVEVKASEDGKNFTTLGGVTAQTDTLTITNLNHFTIFVVSTTVLAGQVCVDAGATGGSNCYTTIQAAIDAATSGDTINVSAGTYNEALNITKANLRVIGAGEGAVLINVAGKTGGGLQSGILVTAPGVTLQGFTLQSDGAAPLASPKYGIKFSSANNGTLRNVTVKGLYRSGIDMPSVSGMTIDHVTAQDNGGNGLGLRDISDSTISNVSTSGNAWGGVRIQSYYGTISGVVVSGTNNFQESSANGGGLYLEQGNVSAAGPPYPITYGVSGTPNVLLQSSDFTYALHGNDNEAPQYSRIWFYKTLANAQDAAALPFGQPGHITDGRYIQSLTDSNLYVPSNLGSIQKAIDAALAGETINVAAGIYAGNITINKSLTVLGNPGDAIVGPGEDAPVIDGGSTPGSAFFVTNGVTDVTIKGFEMRNFTSNSNGVGNGVSAWVANTTNITVEDNYLHNLGWNGVLVGNDGALGDHSNWTIKNNIVANYGAYGLELTNASNSSLENNVIHASNSWTSILVVARRNETGITVKNNQIDGSIDDVGTSGRAAIYILGWGHETPGARLNSVTVENNQISTIGTKPHIRANEAQTGLITGLTVIGNTLSSLVNNTAEQVDATNNWWGDISGPSGQGSGTGGSVSTNVNFSPWCLVSDCSSTSEIYSGSEGGILSGTPQDITIGSLTINGITGTGSIFAAKYDNASDVPGGGFSLGAGNFYYNIQAPSGTSFPVNITIDYSDTLGNPSYLDENHFTSLYYYKDGSWHDYRLDTSASTVAIDKSANRITASLQHLTPIVPAVDITPPAVPTLPSPADGAFVKPAGLILDWSDSVDPEGSNPVKYYYQSSYSSTVGSNNAMTLPIYTSGALPTSQINASGSADHTYYWQVRACDSLNNCSNWSGPWRVTIDSVSPTIDLVFPTPGPSATSFQAVFSENVKQSEAEDPANYFLDNWPGAGGSGNLVGHATISYNSSTKTATVTFTTPGWDISPEQKWGVQNIHDLAGNLLAINPYTEYSTPMVAPTNPGISSTTPNPTDSILQNWLWSLSTDTGGSGVKGYYQRIYDVLGATYGSWSWLGNVLSSTTNLTEGQWQLNLKALDNAGNQSGMVASATTTVDTTAPVIPGNPGWGTSIPASGYLGNGAGISNFVACNGYITDKTKAYSGIRGQATDNLSGINQYETDVVYKGNYIGAFTQPTNYTGTFTPIDGISANGGNGVYYTRVRVIDNAGNKSISDSVWSNKTSDSSWCKLTIDTVAPTVPVLDIPGNNGYVATHNFTFRWNASTDALSITYEWESSRSSATKPDGSFVSRLAYHPNLSTSVYSPGTPDGAYYWHVRAVDNAGNISAWGAPWKVTVDTVFPTSVIGTPTNSGSNSTIVTNSWDGTISGTASDLTSGLARVDLSVQRVSDDAFWNGSSWVSGTEATVRVTASGTSGWSYSLSSPAQDSYTIISHAVDNAGNTESSYKLTIVLDKTIPQVLLSIDPANPDGGNGWYKTDPTITLTPSDNYGVDRVEYQWNSQTGPWNTYSSSFKTPGEGAQILYYRSIDKASNASETGVKNIKYDKAPLSKGPQNLSLNPNPSNGQNIKVKWDEAGDTVGIDHYRITWKKDGVDEKGTDVPGSTREYEIPDTLAEGQWQIRVIAFDGAGNSADASATETVDTSGPVAPTLTLVGTGTGSVDLSWSEISDAADYSVWYGVEPGKYLYSARVGKVTSYTIRGLSAGTYYIVVAAFDNANNRGAFSSEVNTGAPIAGAPGVSGGPAEGFGPAILGVSTKEATPSGEVLGAQQLPTPTPQTVKGTITAGLRAFMFPTIVIIFVVFLGFKIFRKLT